MESDQEEMRAKGEYDVSRRWLEIISWDVMDFDKVVLEPNEVLLKPPEVEGSWCCKYMPMISYFPSKIRIAPSVIFC